MKRALAAIGIILFIGIVGVVGIVVAALAATRGGRATQVLHARAAAPAGLPVDVDVPVGRLAVRAWDEPVVEATARVECGRFAGIGCRGRLNDIRLTVTADGGQVRIFFEGWPHASSGGLRADVQVSVPREAVLAARLGVGRLEISGVRSDVEARLGVGSIRVSMAEAAVADVQLDTGVGAAALRTASGSRRVRAPLGAHLRWADGSGKADVRLQCGVGLSEARLSGQSG